MLLSWAPHLAHAGVAPFHELTGLCGTVAVGLTATSRTSSASCFIDCVACWDERELWSATARCDEFPSDAIEGPPDIRLEHRDLTSVREPLVEVDSEPLAIDILRRKGVSAERIGEAEADEAHRNTVADHPSDRFRLWELTELTSSASHYPEIAIEEGRRMVPSRRPLHLVLEVSGGADGRVWKTVSEGRLALQPFVISGAYTSERVCGGDEGELPGGGLWPTRTCTQVIWEWTLGILWSYSDLRMTSEMADHSVPVDDHTSFLYPTVHRDCWSLA
jgi:hypothetical protein